MITDSISLEQALKQMEEPGARFSITFVTCDRVRKTGGKILHWEDCQVTRPRRDRAATPAARDESSRAANHYANGTRNVRLGRSSQVRKIHNILILELNGQPVL